MNLGLLIWGEGEGGRLTRLTQLWALRRWRIFKVFIGVWVFNLLPRGFFYFVPESSFLPIVLALSIFVFWLTCEVVFRADAGLLNSLSFLNEGRSTQLLNLRPYEHHFYLLEEYVLTIMPAVLLSATGNILVYLAMYSRPHLYWGKSKIFFASKPGFLLLNYVLRFSFLNLDATTSLLSFGKRIFRGQDKGKCISATHRRRTIKTE